MLLSQLVDPVNRPTHRQWVTLEADLSSYAGQSVEIVLETRGFEQGGPPDRAFWCTPTITAADDASRPLVVVYLVDTLRAPQRAAEVVDAALDFFDARKGQPTFLYLHTMDAHTP